VPLTLSDRVVGINAVHVVLAALLLRDRTGEGQSVELPMFETMAQMVLGDQLGGRSFEPPLGKPGYARLLTPEPPPLCDQRRLCLRARLYRQALAGVFRGHRPARRIFRQSAPVRPGPARAALQ
jgi:hypothetical protein